MDVSAQELLLYFQRNSNCFKNPLEMEMSCSMKKTLWTYFKLCDYNEGPLKIEIYTEDDCPLDFLNGFRIEKIKDIDELSYNNSWMRYLNSDAEIIVSPLELQASLSFKIFREKTTIYSMELHFYDEIYTHLTLPEDFEKYINHNESNLFIACENRYRYNKVRY